MFFLVPRCNLVSFYGVPTKSRQMDAPPRFKNGSRQLQASTLWVLRPNEERCTDLRSSSRWPLCNVLLYRVMLQLQCIDTKLQFAPLPRVRRQLDTSSRLGMFGSKTGAHLVNGDCTGRPYYFALSRIFACSHFGFDCIGHLVWQCHAQLLGCSHGRLRYELPMENHHRPAATPARLFTRPF